MPTYDYKCHECNSTFEHFQSMKEDSLKTCLCEKKGSVSRLISNGGGIIFKGSGFYVTDYKKNSPPPESGSGSTPAPTPTPTNSSSAPTPSSNT